MEVLRTTQSIDQIQADALIVGLFQNDLADHWLLTELRPISSALASIVARLLESGEFSGKLNEVVKVPTPMDVGFGLLVLAGLGEKPAWSARAASTAAGSATRAIAAKQRASIVIAFPESFAAQSICSAINGCQGQDLYKKEKTTFPCETLLFMGMDEAEIRRGRILGESTCLTRRLVNQPPNITFPESFADECQQVAQQCGMEIEIWDQDRLNAEKCGALLAVARGSARPPRLVIMRHFGGTRNQQPLALVGKGVTFDSGGLSIKPTEGMKDMKCDMAGAATVLGAMVAISKLQLPVNVVGLMGLVENMVSADSYKLGDVLTARNGKTIEVLNTDAEGRLVLADVLDVALEEQATHIVDLATLTGACVVALGMEYAGLMSNHQDWCDQLKQACERAGELAWQLPMDPLFASKIKSDVADIKNVGNGRWGGAITAAKFLEEFVGDAAWVHIDIAGPSFAERPLDHLDGGASGCFVKSLVELAEHYPRQ
jgi:leucyl aminopeptidase